MQKEDQSIGTDENTFIRGNEFWREEFGSFCHLSYFGYFQFEDRQQTTETKINRCRILMIISFCSRFTVLTKYATTELRAENETLSLTELCTSCRQFSIKSFHDSYSVQEPVKITNDPTEKTKHSLNNNQITARANEVKKSYHRFLHQCKFKPISRCF